MPPVASLFAAFLGYNPMGELIPADVAACAAAAAASTTLTGHAFFPELMSGPFKHGLVFAFTFSAISTWSRLSRPGSADAARASPRCR